MRTGSRLLILIASLTMSGCITTLTPDALPLATPAELQDDYGFLLIEIDSDSPISLISIQTAHRADTRIYLEDQRKGRRTTLLRVPAGEYRWHRIEMMGTMYKGRERPYIWEIDAEGEEWQFRVEVGKVNYPGVLVLQRNDQWLTYFTLNRSGQLAERLMKDSDWLLRKFPAVYTGRRRDDFLEYYSSRVAETPPLSSSPERMDGHE